MIHLGSLPLRVEFVHTLCIADKLGFLDSIEHIAKQFCTPRKNGQQSAVPYVSHPKPRGELKKLSTAQEQLCKAEPSKDHSAAVLHQTEHSLHSSRQQTEPVDPSSFLKKKECHPDDVEHLGNVLEAARLSSSTSDKPDTSRRSEPNASRDERGAKRDKNKGRHSNPHSKTTVIQYYGMGAGRFRS